MKKWLLTLLFILGGMIFPTQALCNSQIESQVAQIYRDYSVRVLYKYDRDQYFSDKWRKAPVNAQGAQMSDDEILRLLPIIREYLSFYPAEVISKNLKTIYLSSELNFFAKSYGATYGKSSLYFKNEHKGKKYDKSFLLGTMHSEFSSILMKNHFFSEAVWKGTNHGGFEYIGNGKDMLGVNQGYNQSTELLARGLICAYAQASVEEDFNMIVFWLFTKPNELKALARKYPIINSKMWMVIDFYQLSVDSRIKL